MHRRLLILFVVLASLAIAGCTIEPSPSNQYGPFSPSTGAGTAVQTSSSTQDHISTLKNETIRIAKDTYRFYDISMNKSDWIKIDVSSDGPIDIMIIDAKELENYESAIRSNENRIWESYNESVYNVKQANITFTAPAKGDYYIVLDNTEYPNDPQVGVGVGANAGKEVALHIDISGT
jgi:hypothetical protein